MKKRCLDRMGWSQRCSYSVGRGSLGSRRAALGAAAVLVAAAVSVGGAAFAQSKGVVSKDDYVRLMEAKFTAMDKDKDYMLSWDEVFAYTDAPSGMTPGSGMSRDDYMKAQKQYFEKMDKNKDFVLTFAEVYDMTNGPELPALSEEDYMAMQSARFERLDKNKDQMLMWDEVFDAS